jgi:hypothetical protein
MLVPATGYTITLLSNTPQNDHWKPADVAVEMYNAASLGPKVPPLLKRVRTTLPHWSGDSTAGLQFGESRVHGTGEHGGNPDQLRRVAQMALRAWPT